MLEKQKLFRTRRFKELEKQYPQKLLSLWLSESEIQLLLLYIYTKEKLEEKKGNFSFKITLLSEISPVLPVEVKLLQVTFVKFDFPVLKLIEMSFIQFTLFKFTSPVETEISNEELTGALKNVNKPVIIDLFGKSTIFYSRRKLITNYFFHQEQSQLTKNTYRKFRKKN